MKIDFLTGKRGGFGAMVPTLRALQEFAEVRVLATDMHACVPEMAAEVREAGFGMTLIDMAGDGQATRAAQLGWLTWHLASVWSHDPPDVLLLIGDRGESLAAAFAAQQLGGIVIAHIEGGDVTGCIDDSARHAITKLAHLHFVTGPEQRDRLIRMGERPETIFETGDVHIDRLMIELAKPIVPDDRFAGATVILHHPDTLHPGRIKGEIDEICLRTRGDKRLFVHPCSDVGHEIITEAIWAETSAHGGMTVTNVPHAAFINGLRQARKFVGNSSSLVKEAPYIDGLAVELVGDRQNGRRPGRHYGDGHAFESIARVLGCAKDAGYARWLLAKRWAA